MGGTGWTVGEAQGLPGFGGYLQAAHAAFGRYPRYAIGMSSRGPEYFLPGYDFVAASKTVMETFCRTFLTSIGFKMKKRRINAQEE